MQRYVQGFLPSAFSQVWLTNQERRDGVSNAEIRRLLRNSEYLNIPFVRLSTSTNQPLVKLPKTWVDFPHPDIKILRNKNEFNKKLKQFFIDNLSLNVNCERLLCPTCHLNNHGVI